jgi:hypothetical protein
VSCVSHSPTTTALATRVFDRIPNQHTHNVRVPVAVAFQWMKMTEGRFLLLIIILEVEGIVADFVHGAQLETVVWDNNI